MIATSHRLDVRSFACPLTWVKTRIALERLGLGEVIEVWLPPGEPLRSVPASAEQEGHRVIGLEPLGGGQEGFRLLLEKGRAPEGPLP